MGRSGRAERILEAQLRGDPPPADAPMSLRSALDSFIQNKEGQSIGKDVIDRNRRELTRFADFAENKGIFTVGAVTLPLLTEYRGTWTRHILPQLRGHSYRNGYAGSFGIVWTPVGWCASRS